MTHSPVQLETIRNKIGEIKQSSQSQCLTNYFMQELISDSFHAAWADHSIVFFDADVDFHRLYFFSSDLKELSLLIRDAEFRPSTVDIITKRFTQEIHAMLLECGFENIALYKRIENKNFPVYQTNDNFSLAESGELNILYKRLYKDFDKYLDHFPTIERLKSLIEKKHVIVVREKGTISGYVIYKIQGKKVHLNYWYNEGNPLNSLHLLVNYYGIMHEKGIRSGYGWVNVKKQDVIKTHQKFGYTFDGLHDYIYVR